MAANSCVGSATKNAIETVSRYVSRRDSLGHRTEFGGRQHMAGAAHWRSFRRQRLGCRRILRSLGRQAELEADDCRRQGARAGAARRHPRQRVRMPSSPARAFSSGNGVRQQELRWSARRRRAPSRARRQPRDQALHPRPTPGPGRRRTWHTDRIGSVAATGDLGESASPQCAPAGAAGAPSQRVFAGRFSPFMITVSRPIWALSPTWVS